MSVDVKAQLSDAKRLQIEAARTATVGPADIRGYTNLSTGLREYEKLLLDGKSLEEIIEEMHKIFPGETIKILDFGCGHNQAMRELIQKHHNKQPVIVAGLSVGDPRTEEEKNFDEEHRIVFLNKDLNSHPLTPDTYHIIVSRLTLGHLTDPLETLVELYNSLREHGIMYIHLTIRNLAKKFDSGMAGAEALGPEAFQESIRIAKKLIADLKTEGVDIQNDDNKLIIRKNHIPLSFHQVKISPLVSEGLESMGVYSYE